MQLNENEKIILPLGKETKIKGGFLYSMTVVYSGTINEDTGSLAVIYTFGKTYFHSLTVKSINCQKAGF